MELTIIIIVVTVAISVGAFNNPSLLSRWMFNAFYIKNANQYYRFLTSGFIHKDWMHLLFNMFTLYFLGRGVEVYFQYIFGSSGGTYFITLYLTAIIISSIPSFIKHRNHEFYNSLGASGGVSAVVFCFILIDPVTRLYIFGLIPVPGFILGALYLIYTIQMSRGSRDNINHDAHLWGSIYGILFLIILRPSIVGHFLDQLSGFSMF